MRGLALLLVLALAGCAATPSPEESRITVFAAASLNDSFEQLADAFSSEHPEIEVVLSFGGSSALAQQIVEGAPADVFAAASPDAMTTVTGLTESSPINFATNTLSIAVPPSNPGDVDALEDFANSSLDIAVCAVEVPCGASSSKLFTASGITPSVDTYEQDVKAVLTKVTLGEVDAGLVYVTDVLAAGDDVLGIEFAEAASVVSVYPIATITDSEAAAAFVAFVLSPEGQSILAEWGFGAP